MKIECSECKKIYAIKEGQLPKGKVITFKCQNCGAKIHLDLREDQLKNDNFPPEPKPKSETNEKSLKDMILERVDELPPLPQVVMKIRELIRDDNADTKKIAEVIETDQAIATKVLKIANSPYYGMSGKISSIQHASVVLGNKALGEIVTLAGSKSVLSGKLPGYGYDPTDLWLHSLVVALGSKLIANIKNPDIADDAYTAGLIHDVGKIILDAYILDRKVEIESFMEKEEKTFLDAEDQFFEFNHAEIAFEVCKKWNFPESISTAIKGHHRPSISDGDELSYILHMADYAATLIGIGYDDDDILYEVEEGTMDFLGLKQEDVSELTLKIGESVNQISS